MRQSLQLTISVDDLRILTWYIDGAHNIHWDYKGHRGAMLTFEMGVETRYLQKVKLNKNVQLEQSWLWQRFRCRRYCGSILSFLLV
jgi:hypothetical protein